MNRYALTEVYRDRHWFRNSLPEISDFWQLVLRTRESGVLPEEMETPTVKPREKAEVSTPCLIVDSESEESKGGSHSSGEMSPLNLPSPKVKGNKVYALDR